LWSGGVLTAVFMKNTAYRMSRKLFRFPALRSTARRGQTAIEYLLVTVSLLVVFVVMYQSLQWYLSGEFTRGGLIILRMYKEDAW